MNNTRKKYYKSLFLVGAFYDWILGSAFLFFYKPVFRSLGIVFPPNPAYLSLSAAFVFVLGFAYYFAYKNLKSSQNLIKLGTIYKFAYTAVGVYYFMINLLPHPVFLIFGFIDIVFAILSIEFLIYLRKR